MIETLFLDAGGVLVFPNWQRVSDILAAHCVHVSAAALRAGEPRAKFALDDPHRIARSNDAQRVTPFFDLVLRHAGVPPSPAVNAAMAEVERYHAEHNLWEDVPPDVIPALARAAAMVVLMAVVSNANGVLHRAFDRAGLTGYFHTICDSCLEGVEKPDAALFRIVLARAGARPDTTLHVGDVYHIDIVGARNTGIRALLLDPHHLYGAFDAERVKTLDEVVDRIALSKRA